MKLNTKGFSPLNILLLVVIVGLIGGVGYYVYNSQKKTNTELDNAAMSQGEPQKSEKKKEESKKTEEKDETADWKLYTSEKGGYSFRYPQSWLTATHPELCSEGLVLIAPSETALGKCASDYSGQIMIASLDGDQSKNNQLSQGYTDVTKTEIEAPMGKGTKYTGVAKGQMDNPGIGGLADGTKVINYVFTNSGKTYIVMYNQRSTYQDVSREIDLLTTKTFKLTN